MSGKVKKDILCSRVDFSKRKSDLLKLFKKRKKEKIFSIFRRSFVKNITSDDRCVKTK